MYIINNYNYHYEPVPIIFHFYKSETAHNHFTQYYLVYTIYLYIYTIYKYILVTTHPSLSSKTLEECTFFSNVIDTKNIITFENIYYYCQSVIT